MIFIGQDQLSLEDFSAVLFQKKEIALDEKSLKNVDESIIKIKKANENAKKAIAIDSAIIRSRRRAIYPP